MKLFSKKKKKTKHFKKRFKTEVTQQYVANLIDAINSKRRNHIELCPPYQRGVVWPDAKMQSFIDSIFLGIIPNNIIFNRTDTQIICIDGKQRLTSIDRYSKNKICVKLKNPNNTISYVYYDKLPDIISSQAKIYRILTDKELSAFENTKLNIVQYNNLSYEDQSNIFERIQNGMDLTLGEKIISFFISPNMANLFERFAENHKHYLKSVMSRNKYIRRNYNILFIQILYAVMNNKLEYLKTENIVNFVKTITNEQILSIALKNMSDTLIFTFNKNIKESVSKLIRGKLFAVIYYNYDRFIRQNVKILPNEAAYVKLSNTIKILHSLTIDGKKQQGTHKNILNQYLEAYDKLLFQ